MTLFIAKTYFNEEAVSILGVFSSEELAKRSIEEAYPIHGIVDYLVAEYPLDQVNTAGHRVWEYHGKWVAL